MKTISLVSLLAIFATISVPKANAGDDAGAFIGGLIGGAIIGSVLADDDVHTSVSVGFSSHGYYDWVSVRTWVPGYHTHRRDHCGNLYRVWVSGHYTHVKQKVWVSGSPRHYDRYDRHDHRRDHRYGHFRDTRRSDRGPDQRHGDNRRSRPYGTRVSRGF